MDAFQIKTIDDITIVKVDLVNATITDSQPLWDMFENNLLFYRKKTIIDFSQCNYVDHAFFQLIIRIFKKTVENENQLKLISPQGVNIDIFWSMGIEKVIDCYITLSEAVDSYYPKPPNRYINYY